MSITKPIYSVIPNVINDRICAKKSRYLCVKEYNKLIKSEPCLFLCLYLFLFAVLILVGKE